MNIDDYIRDLEDKGILQETISSTLSDYHSHSDFMTIATWDRKGGYNQKPQVNDETSCDDTDYILSRASVDRFMRQHKIKPRSEKETKRHYFFYVECINSSQHTKGDSDTECFISIDKNNGMINYHCNHTHCDGIFWKDYKKYFEDRDGTKTNTEDQSEKRPALIVRKMSDIEIRRTDFLYPRLFPRKFCIVSAYPGSGKTYLVCYLVACVSNGKAFFSLKPEQTEPQNVIYFSSEDGYEDTIKPRLIKCCANMDYISAVDFDDSSDFDFADPRLEELIRELKPALIVFDTLQNFIGNVNMNAANETTKKMRPLVRLADKYNVCILCVCHFNKNEKGSAITRTIGSTDITGKCRSYMTIGNVPDSDDLKYLSHEKSNVGALADTILFSIDDLGIHPEGTSKMHSDDYTSQRHFKTGKNPDVINEVKEYIVRNMPDGKRKASEMLHLMTANGFSDTTVHRAKQELDIKSVREGYGDSGSWFWVLPDNSFDRYDPYDYTKDDPVNIFDDPDGVQKDDSS